MGEQLVTHLLPTLVGQREEQFNVFSVMRHGTFEKQLSNVFAWLFDDAGTHKLGDSFQRIFLSEVNSKLEVPILFSSYSVRQEVNTSEDDDGADVADLVLENDRSVLVVENYYTSSGHGHSYDRYLRFGQRGGKRSEVVLLCEYENNAEQADGWENASVVPYSSLVDQLNAHLDNRGGIPYREPYPEQYSFLKQMQRRYGKGRPVDDQHVIAFINALCSAGEASRYGLQNRESAALNFADHVRERARDRFLEGRELLARIKRTLRDYCAQVLRAQVNAALSREYIIKVSATYRGIYEWTVNFDVLDDHLIVDVPGMLDKADMQLKFGPSAWYANETDLNWEKKVACPDYTHLFITSRKASEVRQSAITLTEVLDNLPIDDYRLRDEIVQMITEV